MREIKLPTPRGTLRSPLGLSYSYPVIMRSVEGDAELSTSSGLWAAKIWGPRRCVLLAQAIGTRRFSHHIWDTASLSRVWITLNQLLYAPLGHAAAQAQIFMQPSKYAVGCHVGHSGFPRSTLLGSWQVRLIIVRPVTGRYAPISGTKEARGRISEATRRRGRQYPIFVTLVAAFRS